VSDVNMGHEGSRAADMIWLNECFYNDIAGIV
jgi:hypothetical protein